MVKLDLGKLSETLIEHLFLRNHESNVKLGALDGGSQCCMSNLRNGNVTCPCHLYNTVSHVKFKKGYVPCHYSFYPLSHVTKPYVACQI